jgi:hypothetical protein
MITFVRFKGQLFLRFYHLFLHLLYFTSKHYFGGGGRIDTVGFDGDHNVTIVFKEVMSIEGDDSSLIWLRNIGKTVVRVVEMSRR